MWLQKDEIMASSWEPGIELFQVSQGQKFDLVGNCDAD